MSRLVREFIEVPEYESLDRLIETLSAIRDSLPETHGAELRLRGDDVFGRTLVIGFHRPLTAEEAACERRYTERDEEMNLAA